MKKSDFFALRDKAKGDVYLSSHRVGMKGRRSIVLYCNAGFDDDKLPRTQRIICIASRNTFEETFNKYTDWLDQWRLKKNERAPVKRARPGRLVATPPGRRSKRRP